ncbi:MAG TPA: hypothetical protein VGM90_10770 [Kofleriaceae bacterium]
MFAVCTFALTACGRFGFAVSGDDASTGSDAPVVNGLCNRSSVADDPLTITGHVFHYLDFVGNVEGLAGTVVAQTDPIGPLLTSTTAQTDGSFELSMTTQGTPQTVWLDVALPGYFDTKYWFDYPLVHAIVGPYTPQIRPGDVPIWSGGSLDSVYSSGSVVRDDVGHGSLVVTVVDCNEQPIPDVTISVEPPLGTPTYLGSSGFFDMSATKTIDPYAQAVFLNESPGKVTVHATHASHTFLPYEVSVTTGPTISIVIIHSSE